MALSKMTWPGSSPVELLAVVRLALILAGANRQPDPRGGCTIGSGPGSAPGCDVATIPTRSRDHFAVAHCRSHLTLNSESTRMHISFHMKTRSSSSVRTEGLPIVAQRNNAKSPEAGLDSAPSNIPPKA